MKLNDIITESVNPKISSYLEDAEYILYSDNAEYKKEDEPHRLTYKALGKKEPRFVVVTADGWVASNNKSPKSSIIKSGKSVEQLRKLIEA